MLPLHYLADELNQLRLAHAEELRPGRRQAARRRAARRARRAGRAPSRAAEAVRKAFQLRA
jgi:hypothetical protein